MKLLKLSGIITGSISILLLLIIGGEYLNLNLKYHTFDKEDMVSSRITNYVPFNKFTVEIELNTNLPTLNEVGEITFINGFIISSLNISSSFKKRYNINLRCVNNKGFTLIECLDLNRDYVANRVLLYKCINNISPYELTWLDFESTFMGSTDIQQANILVAYNNIHNIDFDYELSQKAPELRLIIFNSRDFKTFYLTYFGDIQYLPTLD